MAVGVVVVPGYGDSGPAHWQSFACRRHPHWRRVRQADWERPEVEPWVAALDAEVRALDGPLVLVAHSLGCITVVEWATRRRADVRGALLVAPADTDELPFFGDVPLVPLPFPSIVVASRNDPYARFERSQAFAAAWGSRLVDAGAAGHLNAEAGYGDWPRIESWLGPWLGTAPGAGAAAGRGVAAVLPG